MSTRTLRRLFWAGYILLGTLSIIQFVIITWFM